MLDKELILRKISLIQEDLAHLSTISGYSVDEIAADFFKYNTLERLLEKIIVRAIDINQHILIELSSKDAQIPNTYKETFTALIPLKVFPEAFGIEISKSVGTRNALVHEYDNKADRKKIYLSLSSCLHDYHKYCGYILTFVENNQ